MGGVLKNKAWITKLASAVLAGRQGDGPTSSAEAGTPRTGTAPGGLGGVLGQASPQLRQWADRLDTAVGAMGRGGTEATPAEGRDATGTAGGRGAPPADRPAGGEPPEGGRRA